MTGIRKRAGDSPGMHAGDFEVVTAAVRLGADEVEARCAACRMVLVWVVYPRPGTARNWKARNLVAGPHSCSRLPQRLNDHNVGSMYVTLSL